MPRMKKLSRHEVHRTTLDLIDLGFTVAAVAFMTSKTPTAIYGHLENAGRMKNRQVIREEPIFVGGLVTRYVGRIISEPECTVPILKLLARLATKVSSPAAHPAGATRRGSKPSAKKAVSSAKGTRKRTMSGPSASARAA